MRGITPLHIRAVELHDKGLRAHQVCERLRAEFPEADINSRTVHDWLGRNKDKILAEMQKRANVNSTCLATSSPVESSYTHLKPPAYMSGGSFFVRGKLFNTSSLSRFRCRVLIFDIETLPNKGFFFDIFSDRGIALQFVEKAKAVCTISYKWLGDDKAHLLVVNTAYEDKDALSEFLGVYEGADYVVAHYGDGFDIPFINGRLMANGLDPLPLKRSIDTYKVAKKRFGKTLNSNKLDHLAELMGIGNKNKTDASLWVRCANGCPEAMEEMGAYNVQDVELLEKAFIGLRPWIPDRINANIFIDDATDRCNVCGSENLRHIGFEVTQAKRKPQYRCGECGAVSSFKQVKHDKPLTC